MKTNITILLFILLSTYFSNLKEIENLQQKPKAKNVNWVGTWTFFDNAPVDYTLIIAEKHEDTYLCTYNATGIQTYYDLKCKGIDKGTSFELYYLSTNDGDFFPEDRINYSKPILTLKLVNGKIVTYWDQLINNYVEQGNRSGQVCFKKKQN